MEPSSAKHCTMAHYLFKQYGRKLKCSPNELFHVWMLIKDGSSKGINSRTFAMWPIRLNLLNVTMKRARMNSFFMILQHHMKRGRYSLTSFKKLRPKSPFRLQSGAVSAALMMFIRHSELEQTKCPSTALPLKTRTWSAKQPGSTAVTASCSQ